MEELGKSGYVGMLGRYDHPTEYAFFGPLPEPGACVLGRGVSHQQMNMPGRQNRGGGSNMFNPFLG